MALRQFPTSARRMFWDAAWRREKWPVVLNQHHPRRLTDGQASALSSFLADDDGPGSDGPRGDQAIVNVRIAVNEALNDGAIFRPPNENRSIRWFGKGTCEDQVPTATGVPSER